MSSFNHTIDLKNICRCRCDEVNSLSRRTNTTALIRRESKAAFDRPLLYAEATTSAGNSAIDWTKISLAPAYTSHLHCCRVSPFSAFVTSFTSSPAIHHIYPPARFLQRDNHTTFRRLSKMAKTYTYDEVKQHNRLGSCWVILYGNVWDVTRFLPEHPGGSKIILQLAGTDATEEYDPIHPPGTLEDSLPIKAACQIHKSSNRSFNANGTPIRSTSASTSTIWSISRPKRSTKRHGDTTTVLAITSSANHTMAMSTIRFSSDLESSWTAHIATPPPRFSAAKSRCHSTSLQQQWHV
jgi:cytochrome b involved in lipid metabolism